MDHVESQRLIRCGFNEIVAGYTPFSFANSDLFIKHFSARDQISVDVIYKAHIEKLKARGVPTSEEKAKELDRDGLWGKAEEDGMKASQTEVDDLKRGKTLLFIKSQIDAQQESINKAEQEYFSMLVRKNGLFGKTAEFFANKRVSDFCVVNSIFQDRQFLKPYFSREDIFYLDDETMDGVTDAYNLAVLKFDEKQLKRIALSGLFQNYYYLAKSVYEFYGRAICELTFYQMQLVTFGDYYKNVLFGNENPPPAEVASDPDKLEEWVHGSGHAKKVMETTIGQNSEGEGNTFTTLVGAKPEDLDYLGVSPGTKSVKLTDKLKEKGGHLSMQDLMALQGI